ncbi:hypothetical protein WA026_012064 [Henosepilachna vigintioctopunctata]|uniref:IGFBP N-terminal domain-containing protein n=1 Tax=Henosepilachna vigintioctopunctata TaxID=420089 RepID=A0AAW1VAT5_9CUCU
MAKCFAVPTKCDTSKKTELLGKLKTLMCSLEEELTPKVEPVCYTPVCVTNCIPCCPPCCSPCCPPCCPPPCPPPEPPDVLVCYKCKTSKTSKKAPKINYGMELCESKSRELRGGILYIGCDCERKNGLQDNCLRTGCQGSPECLTSPPSCLPSQYCNGKHLLKKMRNRRNGKQIDVDEGFEEPETFSYQCYGASVKAPDQQLCVYLPKVCCPTSCNYPNIC